MKVNLTSDTVTKPSSEMLSFMMKAEVGDDVFGQDPTVNALEAKAASMFGKPAALYCPSGTMTNQIAIKVHTSPLDEVICHEYSHVYQYETAGYAFHSGVAMNLLPGEAGKITADQVNAAIKPVYDWLPISRLVVLENTANKAGGTYYTKEEISPITDLCREKGLKLHLDGARIFNALIKSGDSTGQIGNLFESISICLSKGLGAPVGSLLIGEENFIQKARRFRKVMGGGMRQAGYMAAAGLYALEHNVDRLQEDHDRAKVLEEALAALDYVELIRPVQTNILIFDIKPSSSTEAFIAYLNEHDIYAAAMGPTTMRFVTHLDIDDEMISKVVQVLRGFTKG